MELGLCLRNAPVTELVEVGRLAARHGFREVYVPDGARGAQTDASGRLTGRDAFCGLAAMFAAVPEVRGGVGVAAAPLHQPKSLAMLASTLTELSDGRFTLGIGVSHAELTKQHGVAFPDHPVDYMRTWLDELRAASDDGVAYGAGWPTELAALGPRMVELGARHADGLVLNWLTPEHAAKTVDRVREAADGRSVRTVLYQRLMPSDAARLDVARYDAFRNYHLHFEAQGLTDAEEIAAGTILPIEDLDAARRRIEEYRDTGLDLLCLYPFGVDNAQRDDALVALAGSA